MFQVCDLILKPNKISPQPAKSIIERITRKAAPFSKDFYTSSQIPLGLILWIDDCAHICVRFYLNDEISEILRASVTDVYIC